LWVFGGVSFVCAWFLVGVGICCCGGVGDVVGPTVVVVGAVDVGDFGVFQELEIHLHAFIEVYVLPGFFGGHGGIVDGGTIDVRSHGLVRVDFGPFGGPEVHVIVVLCQRITLADHRVLVQVFHFIRKHMLLDS
jgi:hypothetical protein